MARVTEMAVAGMMRMSSINTPFALNAQVLNPWAARRADPETWRAVLAARHAIGLERLNSRGTL